MHGAPSPPRGRRRPDVADMEQGPSRGVCSPDGRWCRRLPGPEAGPNAHARIPRRNLWRSSSPDATSRSRTDSASTWTTSWPRCRSSRRGPADRRRRDPRAKAASPSLRPGRDHLPRQGAGDPGRGLPRRQVRRAGHGHGQAPRAPPTRHDRRQVPPRPPRAGVGGPGDRPPRRPRPRPSTAGRPTRRRPTRRRRPAVGDSPIEVREKVHATAPMTLEEALYQMELVGHDFFLFHDPTPTARAWSTAAAAGPTA